MEISHLYIKKAFMKLDNYSHLYVANIFLQWYLLPVSRNSESVPSGN